MKKLTFGLASLLSLSCQQKESLDPVVPEIEIKGTTLEIEEIIEKDIPVGENYHAKPCSKVKVEYGVYLIEFSKEKKVFYNVSPAIEDELFINECELHMDTAVSSKIIDEDCDNTADNLTLYFLVDTKILHYNREELEEKGHDKILDQYLSEARKHICAANKIDADHFLLKEALKHYQ